MLNDSLASTYGDEAIRYSLMVTGAVSLWAVVHSGLAAQSVRSDLLIARGQRTADASE
jgi:hypothetical protein